jgi:translation initiation factor 2 beta subunit (eIF-2beta)/eIF-5
MSDSNTIIELEHPQKKEYAYSPETLRRYYEKSLEKHRNEYVECKTCGKFYTYFNHYHHKYTQFHLEALEQKVKHVRNI